MTTIAHIRASVRKVFPEGYSATLHISDKVSGLQYSRKLYIRRVWPKDAIYDAMQEAKELAELNGYLFKATYTNAGDVVENVKVQS